MAAGGCLQSHQHLGKGGFAAAALADDGERFAFAGFETEGLIGLHHLARTIVKQRIGRDLIVFAQIVDFEHHVANVGAGLLTTDAQRCGPIDFVMAQTAGVVAVISGDCRHLDVACITAPRFEIVAPRAKVAAGWAFVGQGEIAGDRHQWAGILVRARQRDRTEQRLCVRVAHLVKDVVDRAALYRFAGIHHTEPVAGFQHQAKVV